MKKGFTLIEILVTIALISLMVGAGAANYQRTSRTQSAAGTLNTIRQAVLVAKSNALTGKKDCSGLCGPCDNSSNDQPLAGWVVQIDAGNKQYKVDGYCGTSGGAAPWSNTNFTNSAWKSLPSTVTVSVSGGVYCFGGSSCFGFLPLNNGFFPGLNSVNVGVQDASVGFNGSVIVQTTGEVD